MSEKVGSTEIKLFGKWSFENVKIEDLGLVKYICLKPVFIPHSGGKHEFQRFKKSDISIVERLINQLMRPGKNAGLKAKAYRLVKSALEIVYLKTNKNPVEVLVQAVENAAPCEDTTRISYGGIVYHMSVDLAPQRRVDLALRFIAEGVRKSAWSNVKTVDECLADEIILAARRDSKSYGVSKRDEQERIALSSR